MGLFRIALTETDLLLLKRYKISIYDNTRLYSYSLLDKGYILDHGCPYYFRCGSFYWHGKSWKSLTHDFCNWFIEVSTIDNNKLLELSLSFSKQAIFKKECATNSIGPLKNGLYINGNHTSNHMWWQILELIEMMPCDFHDKTEVLIHYPSAIEPKEVVKMIWNKEMNLFKKFLLDMEYTRDETETHLENVKKINGIYRKISSSTYIFIMDRKLDFTSALSKLRKYKGYIDKKTELQSTLENIILFKDELHYPDILNSNLLFR